MSRYAVLTRAGLGALCAALLAGGVALPGATVTSLTKVEAAPGGAHSGHSAGSDRERRGAPHRGRTSRRKTRWGRAVRGPRGLGNRRALAAPVVAAPVVVAPVVGPTGVVLPIAPQDYDVPAGGVDVSNGHELAAALSSTSPRDIVLAAGTYSSAGTGKPYFAAATGHRLWAARRGGAVLTAGLVLGGNYGSGGAEVHGLAFDITDRSRTYEGAALHTWGRNGVGAKVFDSTVEGHYALHYGLQFRQVQEAVIQRVVVRNVRRAGVYVSDCCDENRFDNTARARTISDVEVAGVREPEPGSADGRAEYGLWVGNPVVNPVERVQLEHAWWSGLWTGSSSRDTVFRHITIATVDRENGNAIYAEHRTVRNTFEHFRLGPNLNHGVVCEWNFDDGVGACDDNAFRDGTIESRKTGFFFSTGQRSNEIARVRFVNQTCAAIVDNEGQGNTFSDNDFAAIAAGAVRVADYCY